MIAMVTLVYKTYMCVPSIDGFNVVELAAFVPGVTAASGVVVVDDADDTDWTVTMGGGGGKSDNKSSLALVA
jgi:hypothetical protein